MTGGHDDKGARLPAKRNQVSYPPFLVFAMMATIISVMKQQSHVAGQSLTQSKRHYSPRAKMFVTRAKKLSVVLFVAASAVAFQSKSAVIFQDGFESGTISRAASGKAGWASSNAGPQDRVEVSKDRARAGTYSLKLTYGAGADGDDAWSEQRFELGGKHKEIWIKYDLYVPTNYYHRTQSTSGNNKSFVHMWASDYDHSGWGGGFEIWPDGTGAGHLAYHNFSPDQPHRQDSTHNSRGIELTDRGKWIQIIAQVKLATSANNDGEARVWKTREGGQKELIFEQTRLPIYNAAENYIERGYIFGWSNSGYAETTSFYIDNVVIANSPIDVIGPSAPRLTVQ